MKRVYDLALALFLSLVWLVFSTLILFDNTAEVNTTLSIVAKCICEMTLSGLVDSPLLKEVFIEEQGIFFLAAVVMVDTSFMLFLKKKFSELKYLKLAIASIFVFSMVAFLFVILKIETFDILATRLFIIFIITIFLAKFLGYIPPRVKEGVWYD